MQSIQISHLSWQKINALRNEYNLKHNNEVITELLNLYESWKTDSLPKYNQTEKEK
jgi:hypothetical protein